MQTEIWKPINNYEDRYEISNLGQVRCLKSRKQTLTSPKTMNPEIYSKSQTQYKRVQLSNPRKRFLVHRLVAEHFIDNPDNKPNVNHKDNNGLNNSIDNLEWCTQSENLKHAQTQGRLTVAQSKGGKIQGERARITALANADALVGEVFGTWQVIKNLGFVEIGSKGVERIRLMCKCHCGMHYEVDKFSLTRNPPKVCKNCINKSKI